MAQVCRAAVNGGRDCAGVAGRLAACLWAGTGLEPGPGWAGAELGPGPRWGCGPGWGREAGGEVRPASRQLQGTRGAQRGSAAVRPPGERRECPAGPLRAGQRAARREVGR